MLEVADHGRYRKMFAVQSHERITRKKTDPRAISSRKKIDEQSRIAPQNLIAAHPVQDSQADEGSGGNCSPAPPCAQRYGTGKSEGC